MLVLLLEWGTEAAWARSGASPKQARRAGLVVLAGALCWMAATWIAADRGVLLQFDRRPPPFAVLFAGILGLAGVVAFGRLGTKLAGHLPLAVLVGIQGFRFPLELAMHQMYERGIMPVQMSYSGRNWDIVTGIAAIAVAALIATGIAGRRLAFAWNVFGLATLTNIIVVAVASTPFFQYFGPDQLNVWVMYPPFVWLPAVLVLAALAGHLIVFRALRRPA